MEFKNAYLLRRRGVGGWRQIALWPSFFENSKWTNPRVVTVLNITQNMEIYVNLKSIFCCGAGGEETAFYSPAPRRFFKPKTDKAPNRQIYVQKSFEKLPENMGKNGNKRALFYVMLLGTAQREATRLHMHPSFLESLKQANLRLRGILKNAWKYSNKWNLIDGDLFAMPTGS